MWWCGTERNGAELYLNLVLSMAMIPRREWSRGTAGLRESVQDSMVRNETVSAKAPSAKSVGGGEAMSDAHYRGESLAELTRAIALEADVLKRLDLVQTRIELKARPARLLARSGSADPENALRSPRSCESPEFLLGVASLLRASIPEAKATFNEV